MPKLTDIISYADPAAAPVGENELSPRALFYQRSLYKEYKYPPIFPAPLDTWYDKLLYGRVNQIQQTIVPRTANLVQVPSSANSSIMALNVMVTAFEKFVTHMKHAVLVGAVDKTANQHLLNLRAHGGWKSATTSYLTYRQNLYKNFMNNLTAKQNSGITNFHTFLPNFRDYLLSIAPTMPVTKTNFILSNQGSIFNSGLSISIASADASADYLKFKRYLTDPNFEFYRRCAKKYGLMVNKNMPWVLTADLFSEAFFHVATYGYYTPAGDPITENNFFRIFYRRTAPEDLGDLADLLTHSYIAMTERRPFYDDIPANPECPIMPRRRPLIYANTASAEISHKFLIDLYIDLRLAEIRSPWGLGIVNYIKDQAYQVYRGSTPSYTSMRNVSDYIDAALINFIYSDGAVYLQANDHLRAAFAGAQQKA